MLQYHTEVIKAGSCYQKFRHKVSSIQVSHHQPSTNNIMILPFQIRALDSPILKVKILFLVPMVTEAIVSRLTVSTEE